MQRSLIRRSINATFHMNILKEKRGETTLTEEEKTVTFKVHPINLPNLFLGGKQKWKIFFTY